MAKPKQRVKQVGIRFSEEELAKIKDLADNELMNLSSYIRKLALTRLKQLINNR